MKKKELAIPRALQKCNALGRVRDQVSNSLNDVKIDQVSISVKGLYPVCFPFSVPASSKEGAEKTRNSGKWGGQHREVGRGTIGLLRAQSLGMGQGEG